MESTYKSGTNGTENNGVKVANKRTISSSDFFLRLLGFLGTLVAIIVLAVSKQSKTVPMTLLPGLPPFNVDAVAKWQYLSAFTFFMVSNIIACVYAAITLTYSIFSRLRSKNLGMVFLVLDLAMMSLLFSANGAAAAVGVLGYKGNSHVQWKKVCNVFEGFCHHVAGSIAVSLIGCLAFFFLIVLTTHSLHKRSH